MNKREKEAQQRQEDQALHRFLFWAGGALTLILLLLLAKRFRVDFRTDEAELAMAAVTLSKAVAALGAAAAVLGAVWWALCRVKGRPAFSAGAACLFSAALAVSGLAVWQDDSGVKITLAIWAAAMAAVLALIYYLYQRDFFVVAATVAVDMVGIWLLTQLGRGRWSYLFIAVVMAAYLAAVVCGHALRRSGGVVRVKEREVRILPARTNYALLLISAGLTVVLLLAVLALLGSGVPATAFYAVPVAWLFVTAVYYTVKMM